MFVIIHFRNICKTLMKCTVMCMTVYCRKVFETFMGIHLLNVSYTFVVIVFFSVFVYLSHFLSYLPSASFSISLPDYFLYPNLSIILSHNYISLALLLYISSFISVYINIGMYIVIY